MEGEEVISLIISDEQGMVLVASQNGYGKRSSTYEYRRTNRGGQGIINIVTSERNGGVVASFPVTSTNGALRQANRCFS